jgi:hypothetical protein
MSISPSEYFCSSPVREVLSKKITIPYKSMQIVLSRRIIKVSVKTGFL